MREPKEREKLERRALMQNKHGAYLHCMRSHVRYDSQTSVFE